MNRVADDCYATWIRASQARRLRHLLQRRSAVYDFLDATFSREQAAAVGFKFMYAQSRKLPYRFPHVMEYATANAMRVVHVIRRNYLRTLISRETAAASRIYHATEKIRARAVRLEPATVIPKLNALRDEDAYWRKRLETLPHVNVFYEEFVENRGIEADRISEFLGVSTGVELQSRLVKINPSDLAKVVANFDEIEPAIRGTDFEFCLDG